MLLRHQHYQVTIPGAIYPVIGGTVTDTTAIVSTISSRLLCHTCTPFLGPTEVASISPITQGPTTQSPSDVIGQC